jgi:hypothetical protein
VSERDEAIARVASLTARIEDGYVPHIGRLQKECFALHAELGGLRATTGAIHLTDIAGRPAGVVTPETLGQMLSGDAKALIESGPGIAKLPGPDNSLAFLDEDLLADDAD